jgi:hypothetical protein
MNHYLPLDAWHLIKRLARRHNPRLIGPIAVFFFIYALMARLRTGRTADSILLSVVTTSILIFVAACIYILATHSGYRLF